MAVCLTVSLAWTLACRALNGDSGVGPYGAITTRNIFDMRTPPPKDTGPTTPPTPPPNVKLIGLMLISGHPQGVFSIQDPAPGKPPVNYILGEDQRQAMLDVITIDMAGKKAKVQIGDDTAELKLEDPKAATSGGAAPGAGPGQGSRPMMPGGRGGMRGGFGPQGGFSPTGGYNPAGPSASYNPGASPDAGSGALPTRPVRTDSSGDQQMTAEQQIILMEQQREQYLNSSDPREQEIAGLLPPTPLTAALQQQRNAAAAAAAAAGGDTAPPPPTTPSGPQIPIWGQPKSHNYVMPPGQ